MAAVDIIITLAIIIKIIDIFVMRHKKKIKKRSEKPETTSLNKAPVIIIIMFILIGLAATNQKETDPKPIQQINATSQTSQANAPTGIYIQPLLSATTGIMNQMGNEMVKNAERVQQEARRKVAKANQ